MIYLVVKFTDFDATRFSTDIIMATTDKAKAESFSAKNAGSQVIEIEDGEEYCTL